MTKDLENNFVSINQIKEVIARGCVKTLQAQAGYEGEPRKKKLEHELKRQQGLAQFRQVLSK